MSGDEHLGDPQRRAAWRRRLLGKGAEVASALEAILSGKEVDLQTIGVAVKASENVELRLRAFLDRIDRSIKAFDTEPWGRCRVCAQPFGAAALDETPWLERCDRHEE